MKNKLSLENKKKMFELYLAGTSLYELGKLFNIRHTTVKYHLLKKEIVLREGNQNKKYTCNNTYFENISSHQKAYWLGFIAADGSVNHRQNCLSIGLAIKDLEHLKLFQKDMGSDSKIFIYDSFVKGKQYTCCKLTIYSKKLVSDLAQHNIIPNKSKTLIFSKKVPKEYISSYILGIIDGDGCFSLGKDNQVRLTLISSYNVVSSIQEIFKNQCQISGTIHEEKRSKNMYYFSCGGNKQLSRIYDYLYQSPRFLERKRTIAKLSKH